ncbi:2-hydroxyacid dehydrogenase [Natranaerobius thermophilus]|uniref:D-isomer specific 2-hydroxyacid dehydrogenase NAD-binding n=1 Tax=Natranaerobius thermophilus (strain ATCC BAA-1301 / DSM 18059 / JW/NM-WN-LF) TaxID=457570 RepID=B2A705_NATTJ|nr:D-glycerate dehydrogenase [Natranaerobius thermophilus]ACB85596.1 D-isomer specific 2-hydroxyacid dehydrogenase NAD-binding [Natranaerobius thermophilus JW/NM-WN-LF]
MLDHPKVYVTSNIPEAGLTLLKEKFKLNFHQPLGQQITEDELIEAAKSHDALITTLTDPVTERVAAAGQNGGKLKVVANYGAGYDNIAVDAFSNADIRVTNTPGVLHETTADLTFALIMGIARRINEAEKFLRSGQFQGWKPDLLLGEDVHDRTIGIIGMGEIGQAVAKRALGFNMEVIYYNRSYLSQEREQELQAQYKSLEELLSESDFVSIHVPLTNNTQHMITAKEFSQMKNSAFLINTSRGPVIDEQALVDALKTGEIQGAALDVFEKEPEVHPELLDRQDCLLVPHIGSATHKCRNNMSEMACKNVEAVLDGQEPPTPVDSIEPWR